MKEGNLKTDSALDPTPALESTPPLNEAPHEKTAGEVIRAARENVGLHIAALSVALKVPVSKLEALEANQWEALPGMAFARGLAASVCRHLKLDPQPVLQLMPSHAGAPLRAMTEGINTPFQKPGDRVLPSDIWKKIRPTVLTVALLLLAAVVMFTLPENWLSKLQFSTPSASSTNPNAVTDANKQVVMETVSPMAVASQTPTNQTLDESKVVDPSIATPASTTDVAQGSAGSATLSVQATGESWVEVHDKDKQVVLKRLFKAGESQQITGRTPLVVSIGNAEKTSVLVSGKAFDLAPVTRENVARFTVN
jgi:cytoskeleton protein RodZ